MSDIVTDRSGSILRIEFDQEKCEDVHHVPHGGRSQQRSKRHPNKATRLGPMIRNVAIRSSRVRQAGSESR
jgi:hypothetical protein